MNFIPLPNEPTLITSFEKALKIFIHLSINSFEPLAKTVRSASHACAPVPLTGLSSISIFSPIISFLNMFLSSIVILFISKIIFLELFLPNLFKLFKTSLYALSEGRLVNTISTLLNNSS